jgi:prepilin-type N-terminal cleavage/methylation domain-containing protein
MMITSIQRRAVRSGFAGFTLTEMLVALVVGLLVLGGVQRLFFSGIAVEATTSSQTEANRGAQVAMDEMVDRLRGAYAVTDLARLNGSVTPNAIAFSDLDTWGNQRVWRYWRGADGKLYRSLNTTGYSGGVVLASDVQQLAFDGRDQNGNPTASPDQAVAVVVSLTLQKGTSSAVLVSRVRHRNR